MAVTFDSTVVLPPLAGLSEDALAELRELFERMNLGTNWDEANLPPLLSEGRYVSRTMKFDDKDVLLDFARANGMALAVHQDAVSGDHESDFPAMLYWFNPADGEVREAAAGRNSLEPVISISALIEAPAAFSELVPPAELGIIPSQICKTTC